MMVLAGQKTLPQGQGLLISDSVFGSSPLADITLLLVQHSIFVDSLSRPLTVQIREYFTQHFFVLLRILDLPPRLLPRLS
ncbi:hypothetical protein [Thiohalobacter thiocyanaticus]|uniref:hypothetical protein n=1 Tax=Thiohalobacter thiocyanaticus TaxID=585455 RepID=UPI0012FDC9A1|nr:hypothetical protein [Thiohalobacter thiocyanaticus]